MRLRVTMMALLFSGLAWTACDDGGEEAQAECPTERMCPVGGSTVCCPAGSQCKPVNGSPQCTTS